MDGLDFDDDAFSVFASDCWARAAIVDAERQAQTQQNRMPCPRGLPSLPPEKHVEHIAKPRQETLGTILCETGLDAIPWAGTPYSRSLVKRSSHLLDEKVSKTTAEGLSCELISRRSLYFHRERHTASLPAVPHLSSQRLTPAAPRKPAREDEDVVATCVNDHTPQRAPLACRSADEVSALSSV